MSVNAGGRPSPATVIRVASVKCCAKCRRGMPGIQGPCGYGGACVCHEVKS